MTDFLNLGLLGLAVFFGALVRGYAGFGFSAISLGLISLWRSPQEVVPIIFMLEVPASLLILRQSVRGMDWNWVRPLVGGSVVGVPIGVGLLASLEGPVLQMSISGAILLATWAGGRGWQVPGVNSAVTRWLTGVVSGVLNGLSALGGMVCAVVFYATTMRPVTLRATLTILFLFTDVFALVLAYFFNLLSLETARQAAGLMLVLMLGIHLGSKAFRTASEEQFRRFVYLLLLGLGTLGTVKAGWMLLN